MSLGLFASQATSRDSFENVITSGRFPREVIQISLTRVALRQTQDYLRDHYYLITDFGIFLRNPREAKQDGLAYKGPFLLSVKQHRHQFGAFCSSSVFVLWVIRDLAAGFSKGIKNEQHKCGTCTIGKRTKMQMVTEMEELLLPNAMMYSNFMIY